MGLLVRGQWIADEADAPPEAELKALCAESASRLRNRVVAPDDAARGETFVAEAGRYVLYAARTCPFAHRALLARGLLGLEAAVDLALVRPLSGPDGWSFDRASGPFADPELGARALHEIYTASDPDFSGRASVPVLWDRRRRTIVSHSSLAIAQMFAGPFRAFARHAHDLYPGALRSAIDELIREVETSFVGPVLRAGRAANQADYEVAVGAAFAWLDEREALLARRRFLTGAALTLADLVLFTVLVRFDSCYYFGARCNLRRIQDYPSLWAYTRDIYQQPGVAETVNLREYRESYFLRDAAAGGSIVPLGPVIDFGARHERHRVGSANA